MRSSYSSYSNSNSNSNSNLKASKIVRKEANTRDTVNARQFEHWQTDAPHMEYNRPDVLAQPVHNDMNPINTRTVNNTLYFQNQTYEIPNRNKKDDFSSNPYFKGFAPTFDPRNTIREYKSVVFEDKFDKGVAESKKILRRSYTCLLGPDIKNTDSLRPVLDKLYNKTMLTQTPSLTTHYVSASF